MHAPLISGSGSIPNSPRKRRVSCSSPLEVGATDENFGAEASAQAMSPGVASTGFAATYLSKPGWAPPGCKAAGGGGRRGRAASVSSLHRNLLDKTLANKRQKKQQLDLVDADFV